MGAAGGGVVEIHDHGGQPVHVQVHREAKHRELQERRDDEQAEHAAIGPDLLDLLAGHGRELDCDSGEGHLAFSFFFFFFFNRGGA